LAPDTAGWYLAHLASGSYWLVACHLVPTSTPIGIVGLATLTLDGCQEDIDGAEFTWLCGLDESLPSRLPVEPDVIHIAGGAS